MATEPRRLRCQDLIRRLARFGVVVARQRGSHIILLKPSTPGGSKGRTYPVGCHRPTVEGSIPVIRAVLRAFEIPEAAFWAEEWNAEGSESKFLRLLMSRSSFAGRRGARITRPRAVARAAPG